MIFYWLNHIKYEKINADFVDKIEVVGMRFLFSEMLYYHENWMVWENL